MATAPPPPRPFAGRGKVSPAKLGGRKTAALWFKRAADAAEAQVVRALAPIFRAMAGEAAQAVALLPLADPEATARAAFNPAAWTPLIKDTARAGLRRACERGASDEYLLHRPQARQAAPWLAGKAPERTVRLPANVKAGIEGFLKELLAQGYWDDLTEGVRKSIVRELTAGLKAGEGPSQLASRLRKKLGDEAKDRAELIARTETTGALNAGQQEAREDLAARGAVNAKQWLCVRDGATRDEHAAADEQTVSWDGDFFVGGERCQYPGDYALSAGNRCRCRCTCFSLLASPDQLTKPPGD